MRIALLDLGMTLTPSQATLLALARRLQSLPGTDLLVLCPKGAALRPRLDAALIPCAALPGRAWYNPFSIATLRRQIAAFDPSCVHVFGGAAARLAGYGLAHSDPDRTRLVISLPPFPLHEADTLLIRPEQIPGPAGRSALAAVLCPSAGQAERLRRKGFPATMLHVLLQGPARDDVTPLRRNIPEHRCIFLTALQDRNPGRERSLLFAAMSYLRDRTDLPRWELRILCSREQIGPLRAEARRRKLEEHLALLSGQTLEQQMPLCDIAVTAGTDYDEHHLFALYAWRAARPLICPATAPFMEIAGDDRTALFYKPGNAAALASDMLRCMIDANLYRRLRRLGLRRFLTVSLDAAISRILDIYRRIEC